VRRLLFAVAIVLGMAWHPTVVPGHRLPHGAPNTSAYCPVSHPTPATHNPQSQHAQFQDASCDATPTTPNWDRLAALDTITCLQPGTNSPRQPEPDGLSPVNHTPRYLRAFVLLI
jgi:hypothetical protein